MAAALVLLFLVPVWVAPTWVLICRGLGGWIPLRQGMRLHLLANAAKYLPGKVTHAVGLVIALQQRGISSTVGVTSVLVEVALNVIAASFVSLLSLPLLVDEQRQLLLPLAALLVPAGLVALHPSVLKTMLRIGGRVMPSAKADPALMTLSYARILQLLVALTVSWGMLALALFATTQAIYPVEAERLPAMAGIVAASYLFGLAIPFAPAGLGAREALSTLLLSTFIPLPAAVAISVLYRLLGILGDGLAAGFASQL